jgi:hypothetical protein
MLLRFEDGRPFSQGACKYRDRPATELETTPRIFIIVKIEGLPTETAVDTGGVYLLCNPEIAEKLHLDPASGFATDSLMIPRLGLRVAGTLHRLSLTFLAEEGKSLRLEATAFVPRLQLNKNKLRKLPSFMGLMGCLERIRFAVDPTTNTFYFGPIDEGD